MLVKAIKVDIITVEDSLLEVIKKSLKKDKLQSEDILVVTSKVVAVTQGRVIDTKNNKEFERLVQKQADQVFGGKIATLTLKNGIFIPWAGIDRSNIQKNKAILWPKDPYKVAFDLQKELRNHFKIKKLGILIIDSICMPLRRGVSAITLGFAGFQGIQNVKDKKDLFGNKLKYTECAVADMLAASANLVMGEAKESTPFAIVRGAPVMFTNVKPGKMELLINKEKCLFSPLYKKTLTQAKKSSK